MRIKSLFVICLILLPLLSSATLRQSHQHKFQNHLQKLKDSKGRIPLQRDDSIDKKLNVFNLITKSQSILKKDVKYNSFNFNQQTGLIQKTENLHKTELNEKSLMQTHSYMHKSGKVDMVNNRNTFYTGNIGVANQDSNYKMIFDTGSTLIFLNSVLCEDIGCLRGNQYDDENSSTFKTTDMAVEVEYGSGALEGDMGIDTFYIGDIEVKDVEFMEITEQEGSVFQDGTFDGLVGLAFPQLGEGIDTLVDAMIKQNKIEHEQFSIYLSRQESSMNSFISFGDIDKSNVDGEIQYHQVKSPYYWTILAEKIKIGNKDTGLCSKQTPCPLAIDSGTSVLAGPPNKINTLISKISEQNYECSEIADMPSLSFIIDGHEYPLQAAEYMMSVTTTIPSMYQHSESAVDCAPAMMSLDIEDPNYGKLWVMGDIFMTKFYSVFDRENQRVGLGKLKSFSSGYYKAYNGKKDNSD